MSSCYEKVKFIDPLTKPQLDGLLEVMKGIRFHNKKFIRMGINAVNYPSLYLTFSLYKTNAEFRSLVNSFLPKNIIDRSVLEYFLSFPGWSGRLDGQNCWMTGSKPMAIVAFSLSDANGIMISETFKGDEPKEERFCAGNIVVDKNGTYYANSLTHRFVDEEDVLTVQKAPTYYPVAKGQGIVFGLNLFHEIRLQRTTQNWFCIGLPPGVADELFV